MAGTVKRWYELVEYRTDSFGKVRNLLTRNRDKAVEYYKNGGTVEVGYMIQYRADGKWYQHGKFEVFKSNHKKGERK